MVGRKVTKTELARLDLTEADILEDIATGLTITKLREKYNVSQRIWSTWLDQADGRRQSVEQARQLFADTIAEETLSIADSTVDPADAAIARVRIDARKWLAGKTAPEKYGDRAQTEVHVNLQSAHLEALKDITVRGGDDEGRISVDHRDQREQ